MQRTRDVHLTIQGRIQRDPDYAQALWDEAAQCFLDGEVNISKLIRRDLVNATVGFEELAERIQKPSKSVYRMLSVGGNPTMKSLSGIFCAVRPVQVTHHLDVRH